MAAIRKYFTEEAKKEAERGYSAKYYRTHRAQHLAATRSWQARHPDKCREIRRVWMRDVYPAETKALNNSNARKNKLFIEAVKFIAAFS